MSFDAQRLLKGIFQNIAIKDLKQGSPEISAEVNIYAEFRVENEYQLYFPSDLTFLPKIEIKKSHHQIEVKIFRNRWYHCRTWWVIICFQVVLL